MTRRKKIYVYVDEAGQDATSEYFIVVAVATDTNQDLLREQIHQIEKAARTGSKKWHKLRHANRMNYVTSAFQQKIGFGNVYFGKYTKPVPYFSPMITVIEEAIKLTADDQAYQANIYIDGIDKQKAKEITNVLRGNGIALNLVHSRRDESEPLIRLADMWAGCIRLAFLKGGDSKTLVMKAIKAEYLRAITKI